MANSDHDITCENQPLLYSKYNTLLFHNIGRWYKKDENCFPALYILQPVTTWIPNYFNDSNQSLKQQAQNQWQTEYNIMREFLQQAAKEVFKDEDVWQKYVRSGEILFFMGQSAERWKKLISANTGC